MSKKFFLFSFLFFFSLSLFLYSPILRSFFVSDDFQWVWRAKSQTIATFFSKNVDAALGSGVYRPLTSLSYWINYHLHGLNPLPYHLTNVFFFIVTAFVLFLIIKQLTNKDWLAFLAGLFFIILPNHPEAISWISGRGDVLAAFFYLLAFYLYIKFRQVENIKTKIILFVFSLVSFFFSVLAKEMGITLPAIIFFYEIIFVANWHRLYWRDILKRFFYILPFVLILIIYFLLRLKTTSILVGFYASPELQPSPVHYLRTFLVIVASNFLEGYNRLKFASVAMRPYVFFPAVLLSVYSFYLIIKKYTQERVLLLGFLILIIGSLPVLPLSFSATTSEGERFAYLPSLGAAIILGWLVYKMFNIKQSRFLKFLPPIFLMIFLAAVLLQKNFYWQEGGRLSQNLLLDFGQKVDLTQKQGIVVLGLPDNISGAQVCRNGWQQAVGLWYPSYQQDMLVTKVGFNLRSGDEKILPIVWSKTENGFIAKAPRGFFVGKQLESLDYKMTSVGDKSLVEFNFTPEFFNNLDIKPLIFLGETGTEFKVLEKMEKRAPKKG